MAAKPRIPEHIEGQESLFEVPVPETPAPREYSFPSAIPEEELATRAAETRQYNSAQSELQALRALAAENRNQSFREMGNMKNGDIRGDMLGARKYSEMGPEEAADALDTFLAGSEVEVKYIVRDVFGFYADSVGIKTRIEKEGEGKDATSTKVLAENPEEQDKLVQGFVAFWNKYAGTANRQTLLDRRKQLRKIVDR